MNDAGEAQPRRARKTFFFVSPKQISPSKNAAHGAGRRGGSVILTQFQGDTNIKTERNARVSERQRGVGADEKEKSFI